MLVRELPLESKFRGRSRSGAQGDNRRSVVWSPMGRFNAIVRELSVLVMCTSKCKTSRLVSRLSL